MSNNNLIFTIPTEINGELWDWHYHFVLGKIIPDDKNIKKHTPILEVVKLHKTLQLPDKTTKDNKFCFYNKNHRFTSFNDFSNMKCAQSKNTMNSIFSEDDLNIIYSIIEKPFKNTRGGRNKTKRNKNIHKHKQSIKRIRKTYI